MGNVSTAQIMSNGYYADYKLKEVILNAYNEGNIPIVWWTESTVAHNYPTKIAIGKVGANWKCNTSVEQSSVLIQKPKLADQDILVKWSSLLTSVKYCVTFEEVINTINMYLDTYSELTQCIRWYECTLRKRRQVYRVRNVKHALAV